MDNITSPPTTAPLRILDLCCAPGLKLCAISDYLRNHVLTDDSEEATVIGVDCSETRLSTCRKIIEKHQVVPYIGSKEGKNIQIRLYNNDGTKFGSESTNLIFDSTVSMEQCVHDDGRKRRNKSSKGRERKRLKELAEVDRQANQDGESSLSHIPITLFDRVLVDVECSTDGSLKHVRRQLAKQAGIFVRETIPKTFDSLSIPVLTNEEELRRLVDLQRSLLSNGFRLLKKGGYMVYSTCSLSESQNEGVVKWLLNTYPSQTSVIELSFDCAGMNDCEKQGWDEIVKEGSIPGTVRFVPKLSSKNNIDPLQILSDSGFFLAKIAKV
jgi:16S rRNA C967 or C1407 C5-methylase (RsmB/RsmF family)